MKTKQKMMHKMAAAAVAMATSMSTVEAFANNTSLNNLTTNLSRATSGFPNMISMFAYIAGIALAVLGIFKIKQHVDAPANVPLKDGLMRLATGGALLSFPFMTQIIQGSISNGQNTAAAANSLVVTNNLQSAFGM